LAVVLVVGRTALYFGDAVFSIHFEEIVRAVFDIINACYLVIEEVPSKALVAAG
jgi:hypothetical protein